MSLTSILDQESSPESISQEEDLSRQQEAGLVWFFFPSSHRVADACQSRRLLRENRIVCLDRRI